jgi:excisionase family DNA binding protein
MQTASPSLSDIVTRCRDLLDESQAAQYLTLAPGTLSVWRSTGRYSIPFLKVGRRVRYRRADLDAWLETRVQKSGATA